jgi:uncharacterized protein
MTKKKLIYIIFSGIICLAFHSFKTKNLEPDSKSNSLLWEISGNELPTSSFLYGTIHLICKEDLILSEPVIKSLIKSEQLALEINMSDPEFTVEFQKAMVMQEGSNLRNLLNKEDYDIVSKFFQDSLGINIQEVGVVKPFFMNTMLYDKILGCQPQPYEYELVKLSIKNAKPVTGIETIHQQLELFNKIPYKKQAQMLVESIKNFDKTRDMYKELLSLYKKQDIEGAYNFIKSSTSGLEDFEEMLIIERNENWIPVIEKMAQEKATFFAVGAGHLGGEKGLIKLLQERGYKVNPIKYIEAFEDEK